jgi:hypothetical protein
MSLDAVYEIIAKAKHADYRSKSYKDWLEDRIVLLHPSVNLPSSDPEGSLDRFVVRYIDLAPKMLHCISECACLSGIQSLIDPFLRVSVGYFTSPPLPIMQHTGLDGLFVKAYQTHRLIEELYDNNRSLARRADYAMETTQANLLAHHLIGEPFANELDNACEQAINQVVDLPRYYGFNLARYLDQSGRVSWNDLRQEWLSLLSDNLITFKFKASF